VTLTAAALDSLPEGVHTDHKVPGLTLRVGKKRRTWFLRYLAGGQRHKPIIGYYFPGEPELGMSLSAARDKAREILMRVEAEKPVPVRKVKQPKPPVPYVRPTPSAKQVQVTMFRFSDHKVKVTFADLKAAGVVRHRNALHLKIKAGILPAPHKNGEHWQSPAWWYADEIDAALLRERQELER